MCKIDPSYFDFDTPGGLSVYECFCDPDHPVFYVPPSEDGVISKIIKVIATRLRKKKR